MDHAPIESYNYCAGVAYFLLKDKPVLMVLAGRPPAIHELGVLPMDYFAPTVEIPAFQEAKTNPYLERSLPRH